jgi:hypothetical protein
MKTFTYFLIFQIILVHSVVSQNYECLKNDDIYYYDRIIAEPGTGQPPIRAYRIDSTQTSGDDMILFTQKEIIDRDPGDPSGCWDSDAGSWIGNARVTPEGDYYFYNDVYMYNIPDGNYVNVHEEMLIKSQAQLGESWTFYANDSIGNYAYAEMTDIDTLTILGQLDSVKFISVKRYSDDEWLFELRISKNFGLQRTINFRDFFPGEFYPFNMQVNHYEVYALSGKESDETGVHKLTVGDVYDFDIGDEFDVLAEVDSEQGFILAFIYYINTVLDKSFSSNGDTVFYVIDSLTWTISNDSITFARDTVVDEYYNLDQHLPDGQYIPFETKYYDPSDVSYFGMYRFYYDRIHFFDQYAYFTSQSGDTCFYSPFLWESSRTPNWIFSEFIEGCGSYDMEIRQDGYSCVYCSVLMYYSKVGEEWGEKLIPPVGLEERNQHIGQLNVYPNPAQDLLYVKCGHLGASVNKTYRLINSSGMIVSKVTTRETEIKIDVDRLPPGLYLLVLSTDDGLVVHQKVIIM